MSAVLDLVERLREAAGVGDGDPADKASAFRGKAPSKPPTPGGGKSGGPGKWVSAGGVVIPSMDKPEKVYIVKPANNYGPWTFPKGRVDKGESNREAAVREVKEETGLDAKIVNEPGSRGYLGRGTGTMSVTHFFLMVKTGGTMTKNDEMEEIRLVTWERAKEIFKQSGNKRDGAIVDMAVQTLKGMGVLK